MDLPIAALLYPTYSSRSKLREQDIGSFSPPSNDGQRGRLSATTISAHFYPMSPRRGLGLALDPAGQAPVAQDVVDVDGRGRIRLPASVVSSVAWLRKREEVAALMVFDELGRIKLLSWEASGEAVLARRRQLLKDAEEGDTAALEELLLLEDRYHRTRLPGDRRVSLGIQGLLHLGLGETANRRVYVAGIVDLVVIMSQEYRNQRLQKEAAALLDLP